MCATAVEPITPQSKQPRSATRAALPPAIGHRLRWIVFAAFAAVILVTVIWAWSRMALDAGAELLRYFLVPTLDQVGNVWRGRSFCISLSVDQPPHRSEGDWGPRERESLE